MSRPGLIRDVLATIAFAVLSYLVFVIILSL